MLETVVYIAGSGRSGSTLLDMMLGGHPKVFSLGQFDTFDLWLDQHEPCTCGASLDMCPVWGDLVAEARTARGDVIPRPLHVHARFRKVLQSASTILTRRRSADTDAAKAWKLFERTAVLTSTPILIDSSKSLVRMSRLLPDARMRLKVLHLIRDPRGFVASTNRHRQFLKDGVMVQQRLGKLEGTVNWTVHNILVQSLLARRLPESHIVVSYEALVSSPVPTLARICEFLGVDFHNGMLPPIHPRDYHLIGGNSERREGYEDLRLDERWRDTLSAGEQRAINSTAGRLYRRLLRRGGSTQGAHVAVTR